MAKNNNLFGLFLWIVAGVCIGLGGAVIRSFRQSAIGHQLEEGGDAIGNRYEASGDRYEVLGSRNEVLGIRSSGIENEGATLLETLAPAVILSGTKWSRKISLLEAEPVRLARPSFSAIHQQISPLRFAPVEKTNIGLTITTPQPADVFGIYFSNLKRIAHAGFVDEWGDKYVITTEGNTNEAGSNEGDGVYRKRRLISSIYQVADWVSGQERIVEPERNLK